jgi:hypothetical protein
LTYVENRQNGGLTAFCVVTILTPLWGLLNCPFATHSLRCGLHSCAASRLRKELSKAEKASSGTAFSTTYGTTKGAAEKYLLRRSLTAAAKEGAEKIAFHAAAALSGLKPDSKQRS